MTSSTNLKGLLALACLAAAATALPALKSQTLNSTGVAIHAINEVAGVRADRDLAHKEFRSFYHGTRTAPRIQAPIDLRCQCTHYAGLAKPGDLEYCENFYEETCFRYTRRLGCATIIPGSIHCTYGVDAVTFSTSGGGDATWSCSKDCAKATCTMNLAGHQPKLSGRIPAEIGNLTCRDNITELYLHNNDLMCPVPPQISTLTKLSELGLGSNALTGTIPPQISTLTKLLGLYAPKWHIH